jgi:hypothetical protein
MKRQFYSVYVNHRYMIGGFNDDGLTMYFEGLDENMIFVITENEENDKCISKIVTQLNKLLELNPEKEKEIEGDKKD